MKIPLIMGIDPGTKVSAYVILNANDNADPVKGVGYLPNHEILEVIRSRPATVTIACETIRPMNFGDAVPGALVGETTLMTREWVGRFRQRALDTGHHWMSLERQNTIRKVVLGKCRGGDKEIRAALLGIYGPARTKKKGVANHKWSALAVAHTAAYFSTLAQTAFPPA